MEPSDGLAIYRECIVAWEAPNTDDQLLAEDKERILKNIAAALDFLGQKYQRDAETLPEGPQFRTAFHNGAL